MSKSRIMVILAVLAILVLGGTVFAFATNGNTYTGCLGPGGNLTHVAISDHATA